MSPSIKLMTITCLLLGLAACQDSSSDQAPTARDSSLSGDSAARFDHDMAKRGCELLTAELVGSTFDIPVDSLTQRKILGCRYDWQDQTNTLEAAISMIRVHDTEAAAVEWFTNATSDRTAEEMAAQLAKVSKRLDERPELDTTAKKSMAKKLLATIGTQGVTFENVAGVGEAARLSEEGTLYVRVDNLTFMVSAYHGTIAPRPDMSSLGTDTQQMAVRAREAQALWITQTSPQRKTDATRLAKGIVADL